MATTTRRKKSVYINFDVHLKVKAWKQQEQIESKISGCCCFFMSVFLKFKFLLYLEEEEEKSATLPILSS